MKILFLLIISQIIMSWSFADNTVNVYLKKTTNSMPVYLTNTSASEAIVPYGYSGQVSQPYYFLYDPARQIYTHDIEITYYNSEINNLDSIPATYHENPLNYQLNPLMIAE